MAVGGGGGGPRPAPTGQGVEHFDGGRRNGEVPVLAVPRHLHPVGQQARLTLTGVALECGTDRLVIATPAGTSLAICPICAVAHA